MARKYTREEYLELVRKIKAAIPNVALTTDIIVGYPNETEEQFEETLSLYREVALKQLILSSIRHVKVHQLRK